MPRLRSDDGAVPVPRQGSEKIIVACDVSSLMHACRRHIGPGVKLDFEHLANLVPDPVWRRAYLVTHHRKQHLPFYAALRGYGFDVFERFQVSTGRDRTFIDWGIGISLDVVRHLPAFDRFVLITGDSDFSQLFHHLSLEGKRTTAYTFESSVTQYLFRGADEVQFLGPEALM